MPHTGSVAIGDCSAEAPQPSVIPLRLYICKASRWTEACSTRHERGLNRCRAAPGPAGGCASIVSESGQTRGSQRPDGECANRQSRSARDPDRLSRGDRPGTAPSNAPRTLDHLPIEPGGRGGPEAREGARNPMDGPRTRSPARGGNVRSPRHLRPGPPPKGEIDRRCPRGPTPPRRETIQGCAPGAHFDRAFGDGGLLRMRQADRWATGQTPARSTGALPLLLVLRTVVPGAVRSGAGGPQSPLNVPRPFGRDP